jgi:hypothetical protein
MQSQRLDQAQFGRFFWSIAATFDKVPTQLWGDRLKFELGWRNNSQIV